MLDGEEGDPDGDQCQRVRRMGEVAALRAEEDRQADGWDDADQQVRCGAQAGLRIVATPRARPG